MYRKVPATSKVRARCETKSIVLARTSRIVVEIQCYSLVALRWELSQCSCAHSKSGARILPVE